MKLKLPLNCFITFFAAMLLAKIASTQPACAETKILYNPNAEVFYSPDSSKYFINVQDTAGVFQIYEANAGDTPVCISCNYTTGNCCGFYRSWVQRNKLQVRWYNSGNLIICAVEKEFYDELLYTPYSLRLGWLQSGVWMDIWAVKPDGSVWYELDATAGGFTGPAFTPDGNKCAWAEAQDTIPDTNSIFGVWKLRLADFNDSAGSVQLENITDITPVGATWVEPGNFSPNGTSLLISSNIGIADAEGQDQFILDINTGNIRNLTNSPMIWDEHGVFSPDGQKILFMSSYPYRADTNSYHTLTIKTDFMLMDTDGSAQHPYGSNLQQLTHYCDSGYIESDSGIAATGFFNPAGNLIYAQSLIFPNTANWVIEFTGDCGNQTLTGINMPPDNSIRIFPNPAQSVLNIETDFYLINAQIVITNILGQPTKDFIITGNKTSVAINDLTSGVYFLQIQSGQQWLIEKFVKD